jgi:hypothetical protein
MSARQHRAAPFPLGQGQLGCGDVAGDRIGCRHEISGDVSDALPADRSWNAKLDDCHAIGELDVAKREEVNIWCVARIVNRQIGTAWHDARPHGDGEVAPSATYTRHPSDRKPYDACRTLQVSPAAQGFSANLNQGSKIGTGVSHLTQRHSRPARGSHRTAALSLRDWGRGTQFQISHQHRGGIMHDDFADNRDRSPYVIVWAAVSYLVFGAVCLAYLAS